VFPIGERFKDKTQKIKGFGVDLEISVLTLFILVGVGFVLTGVYLQMKSFEDRIAAVGAEQSVLKSEREKLKAERDALQSALERAGKTQMRVLVTLSGVSTKEMPKLEDVEARYFLPGKNDSIPADVGRGLLLNQLSVSLKDVTHEMIIKRLIVEDRASKRKWYVENFPPLEPHVELRKEED
jgi:hypothetical protein